MKFRLTLFLSILFLISPGVLKPVLAAESSSLFSRRADVPVAAPSGFRSQFYRLCDSAIVRIKDNNGKRPFFVDSYGIRSLCVAYDMTGNMKYLDACRSWADRMVRYQRKMIPAGGYYLNYGRRPGQTNGDWYVADCSSIAMGVLSTAVRCKGAERRRLFQSVERFASLVMKKFVRPSGGVTDGLWPQYNRAWWCSSSLFGSLSFILYRNTGNRRYLDIAMRIVRWLDKQDLATMQPLPLSHQGPSLPMYVLECYSAGWPYLSKNVAMKNAAESRIQWCLNWATSQQRIAIEKRKWPLLSWWGAKYGGLPFQEYIYAHFLPGQKALMEKGDREMRLLFPAAVSGKPGASQLTAFMLMSYAQRLDPFAVYR